MERGSFFGLVAGLALCVLPKVAPGADELTVKAAYIYNFAKFIQWPDEQRSTLRLCSMGNDALGKSLDSLIGKPVRNMQISVRHGVGLHDIPQCDLVFIPAGHLQSMERVRQVVADYPILTVTESSDTLPRGATVALIPNESRIAFEVDLALARQLGLQISAKMLQLARKVY